MKRKFIRFQVEVDINEAIKGGGCFLRQEDGRTVWIAFKYEKLPVVCKKCGSWKHGEGGCTLATTGCIKYGDWVRADVPEIREPVEEDGDGVWDDEGQGGTGVLKGTDDGGQRGAGVEKGTNGVEKGTDDGDQERGWWTDSRERCREHDRCEEGIFRHSRAALQEGGRTMHCGSGSEARKSTKGKEVLHIQGEQGCRCLANEPMMVDHVRGEGQLEFCAQRAVRLEFGPRIVMLMGHIVAR